jgi:hypothetical protein
MGREGCRQGGKRLLPFTKTKCRELAEDVLEMPPNY